MVHSPFDFLEPQDRIVNIYRQSKKNQAEAVAELEFSSLFANVDWNGYPQVKLVYWRTSGLQISTHRTGNRGDQHIV